jgi:DNA-3-methyladenine glycosylase
MLSQEFYKQHTIDVAKQLLGKALYHKLSDGTKKCGIIIETESYHGYNDKACHGHKGKTERNKILFETVGYSYIYLCYGIHWLFNISTYQEDFPSGVLIRGIYIPAERLVINGPGKITKYLQISDNQLGKSLFDPGSEIWVAETQYKNLKISQAKRIGVDYAQESKDWEWRFFIDPDQLTSEADPGN